jgi:ribosomal protein S18 acetylase RimI-like enzyme
MNISILPACEEDSAILAELIEEMESYYGATEIEPFDQRIASLHEYIFDDHPSTFVLLAREKGGQVIGMVSYSFLWPALGASRSLFLKELYVREPYRRQGVARHLMKALFEVAAANKCSRVEWTTDHDNAQAKRFYSALGFPVCKEKIFYRLDRKAFSDAANFLVGESDS